MLDRLAAIGPRPRRGRRDQCQLGDHAQMSRQMIEDAQDAQQRIGTLLQQFAFAPGTQGKVRGRTRPQLHHRNRLACTQCKRVILLGHWSDNGLGITRLHLVGQDGPVTQWWWPATRSGARRRLPPLLRPLDAWRPEPVPASLFRVPGYPCCWRHAAPAPTPGNLRSAPRSAYA